MDTLAKIERKHEEERKHRKVEVIRRNAIYARQSIEKKDSISIETQIEECKKLILNDEPFVVYEDRGYSGKNTDRPSFQKMLRDLKAGKIKQVIVYKLDRCTRSVLDFYEFVELLRKYDCDFVSTKERDMDTSTPSGRAMIGMIAIFAQLERETIQQRITDNYYSRIEKDGRWPGGPAPYGYSVIKKAKPARLEYNPNEIEAVKIIYDKYYNDGAISLLQIVRLLESKGFKGRKGKNFRTTAILNILRNPIYVKADQQLFYYFQSIGIKPVNDIDEWDGKQSAHIISNKQGKKYQQGNEENSIVYLTNIEGFIDSTAYIQIQKRLATNKQMARGNQPSAMEWLAGLLKCAQCGYGIRIYSKQRKYLSCFGKAVMHECDVTFSTKTVTFEQVKARVAHEIQIHIDNMEHATQVNKAHWHDAQKEIERLEDENRAYIELALKVDLDELAEKIKTNQKRINELKINADFFTEQTAKYEDIIFANLPDDEKKKIANELIKRVLLSQDGRISIEWKI